MFGGQALQHSVVLAANVLVQAGSLLSQDQLLTQLRCRFVLYTVPSAESSTLRGVPRISRATLQQSRGH